MKLSPVISLTGKTPFYSTSRLITGGRQQQIGRTISAYSATTTTGNYKTKNYGHGSFPLTRNYSILSRQAVGLTPCLNKRILLGGGHEQFQNQYRSFFKVARARNGFELAERKAEVTGEPAILEITIDQHKVLYKSLLESGKVKDADEIVSKYENYSGLFSEEMGSPSPSSSLSESSSVSDKVNNAQWDLVLNDELFDMYIRALAIAGEPDAAKKVFDASGRRSQLVEIAQQAKESETSTASTTTGAGAVEADKSKSSGQEEEEVKKGSISKENVAASAASWLRPDKQIKSINSGGSSSFKIPRFLTGAYAGKSQGQGQKQGQQSEAAPVRVIIEEARGNVFYRILRFLGVTLVYGFVTLSILSLFLDTSGLMRATSGSNTSFKPANLEGGPGKKDQKRVTFDDVHGCDEAKEELQEVVEFLKDPAQFSKLGGKLPKGVLLAGPPGTGKTLLARAVAGEAGVNFFIASGAEFDEMFVGVGAKRIRELFAAARKAGPAIIFIDELDAIGSKRSPRDFQHMKQTLNQLLVELDGFTQTEGIILIGATNVPEALDKALTRPGRFDRHITVSLPDVRGRVSILKHHAKDIRYADDIDMSYVARGTPGFSGAELQNLINQAAIKASKEHSSVVTAKHLEWAKDKILMGAERRSAYITEDSKRMTAYHEGGHALVAYYTKGAMPLHRVTCVPRGMALGVTQQLPEMDKNSFSYLEYLARLDVAMGGRAAEELIYGKENVTSGASSDIRQATAVATAMVRQFGYSDKVGPVYHPVNESDISHESLALIESEIQRFIQDSSDRAANLLKEKRVELEWLKDALMEYETLDPEEIKKVLNGEKLDKKPIPE